MGAMRRHVHTSETCLHSVGSLRKKTMTRHSSPNLIAGTVCQTAKWLILHFSLTHAPSDVRLIPGKGELVFLGSPKEEVKQMSKTIPFKKTKQYPPKLLQKYDSYLQ